MRVLVLGAGKMVRALLKGLVGFEDFSNWTIYSPGGVSAKNLAREIGASFISDLSQLSSVDVVLLGAKPQQLSELQKTLNGRFKNALYLSLLAASSLEKQKKILGVTRMIRVMPNLMVEFRQGVVLLTSDTTLSDQRVEKLLSPVGKILWVTEQAMEELTLLTACGPALFYEFTRSLSRCFKTLDPHTLEKLSREILLASAHAASHSSKDLSTLITDVASRGGVTEAILTSFRGEGFSKIIENGIQKGLQRGKELQES